MTRKPKATVSLPQLVSDESIILVEMQRRLFEAGLIVSAAAVNAAMNKIGWEVARKMGSKT